MAAKFEIYTDAKGEYRFRLKAGNGRGHRRELSDRGRRP